MDIFNQFFKRDRIVNLQRKNDLDYELKYQSELIMNRGFEVLSILQKEEERLLLYRHFYEDVPKGEETSIILGIRIVSKKGIHYPDPILKAFFNETFQNISLADIDIDESLTNHGYGSILLSNLIEIATNRNSNTISGWLSRVDSDHLDRLVYFYKKHNFEVNLNNQTENGSKVGKIVWKNLYMEG